MTMGQLLAQDGVDVAFDPLRRAGRAGAHGANRTA